MTFVSLICQTVVLSFIVKLYDRCGDCFSDSSVLFLARLWDFLEALEDERTGGEYTIIVLHDSDSDSD